MQTSDADVTLDLEQLRFATLEDRKLMRDIVWALIEDTARHALLLEIAIREADAARSVRLARYSAQACLNVGANAAASALRRIQDAAAVRDFAGCREALDALRRHIGTLRLEAAAL